MVLLQQSDIRILKLMQSGLISLNSSLDSFGKSVFVGVHNVDVVWLLSTVEEG